ncbi:hypothetical protein F444_22164 [Phytophthora nicotianae P1976]|uniref:Alternative oxidase n=1 Tax=Phytophthora nicotianae P1976 TaxID=1317066 RepID=A0A080YYN0_PHYNI|nr:hypothetical protein F444_22164 [Phytophthora nicotianae P1976]
MMSGRHILQSCRPHFGFAPHQLSGVLQARMDKSVYFVKPHGLPIVPSHVVWRVFATAPAVSTDEVSPSPPLRVVLGDIKWTAAPLPQIKEMTAEPASLKHFVKTLKRYNSLSIAGAAHVNTKDDLVRKNPMPHSPDAVEKASQTYHKPKKIDNQVTPRGIKTRRAGLDIPAGYRGPSAMTVQDWLNRCLFLETIASVAGMVESMARHLRSARSLKQDDQSIIEESKNERIHQLIFLEMKEPGWLTRMTVFAVQAVTFPAFALAYMVSPRTHQRFVEFLEDEAVKTYTYLLEDMEHGHLDEWCITTAPLTGRNYYDLPDDAKVYDMIKCILEDEARNRDMRRAIVHPIVGLQ